MLAGARNSQGGTSGPTSDPGNTAQLLEGWGRLPEEHWMLSGRSLTWMVRLSCKGGSQVCDLQVFMTWGALTARAGLCDPDRRAGWDGVTSGWEHATCGPSSPRTPCSVPRAPVPTPAAAASQTAAPARGAA